MKYVTGIWCNYYLFFVRSFQKVFVDLILLLLIIICPVSHSEPITYLYIMCISYEEYRELNDKNIYILTLYVMSFEKFRIQYTGLINSVIPIKRHIFK